MQRMSVSRALAHVPEQTVRPRAGSGIASDGCGPYTRGVRRSVSALIFTLVGCYGPEATLGLPCTDNAACDEPEVCRLGICALPSDASAPAEPMAAVPEADACGTAAGYCEAIDVLVVLDNTGSLKEDLPRVYSSLQDLEAWLFERMLANTCSYHIGVVASDPSVLTNDAACSMRGALNRFSTIAPGVPCFAESRPPYLTEVDDQLLLTCTLAVGSDGDPNEQLMDTMLSALSPAMNAPGACNDGFLRTDSHLLIVMLTDEDDSDHSEVQPGLTGSTEGPAGWADQLAAIRPLDRVSFVLAAPTDRDTIASSASCNGTFVPFDTPSCESDAPSWVNRDGCGAELALRLITFALRLRSGGSPSRMLDLCSLEDPVEVLSDVPELLCESDVET